MYTITKQFSFSASHILDHLPDGHPCARLHGHNYVAELVLRSSELNGDGFVRDYNELASFKNFIDDKLDHRHLDDVMEGPSTAENLARFLYEFAKGLWPEVVAVRVSETPKTWAEYWPESMIEKTATTQFTEGRGIRGTISVSEIFGPTVQGEGAVIGKPTVFVRTGGCDYRCSWCDSKFAVLPEFRHTWSRMSPEEVFSEIRKLSPRPILVTLSGGNPALQPFGRLIQLGKAEGYGFTIETQGTLARDWFVELDYLTLSPKPPSSGMETDWEKLARCVEVVGPETKTVMKVVVFDDRDYAYAKEVARCFPAVSMYLQVGNDDPPGPEATDKTEPDIGKLLKRYEWLTEKVVADGWNDATVLPQMHVLVWGNKRGV